MDLDRAGVEEHLARVGRADAVHLAYAGTERGADTRRRVLGRQRGGGVDAEPPAGEPVAGRVGLAVDDVVGGDDQVDAVERQASDSTSDRCTQSGPAEVTIGDGYAAPRGPPRSARRAPGTARAASSGTSSITSASTASGSWPVHGPGSVANTSSARRPVKSERSGSSQPRAAKNAR